MSKAEQAIALQRKILGRWVRMKLLKRHIKVDDIVKDVKDGTVLAALMEELSEKPYTGSALKPQTLRIKQVEQANQVLAFIWASGVEMKIKPSAENIVDGDERSILGLVFAILLKFMKVGDADEEDGPGMNAKDALLLWCNQKASGYAGVDQPITAWKKGFQSALVLAALIHRHRPRMLDYQSLVGKSPNDVFSKVQDAALDYFELEKYITPDEYQALDENSLVIYTSEFYYGIAEQRRLDLAAKRISKVIKLTEENDALRAKYVANATEFKERVGKVKVMLEDRTIDNTMSGAKKRLADFYAYKQGDKMKIISNQLALEGTYNNLAMRLAHNKRPPFVPPAGVALKDVAETMRHLDECEAERKVALHAELNRQIRLVGLNAQHESKVATLVEWKIKKIEYLTAVEESWTVAMATLQLRRLDAFDKERETYLNGSVAAVKALGKELAKEKYEFVSAVQQREGDVAAFMDELAKLSKKKRPALDADLAREQEKERLRLHFAQLASDFDLWAQETCEGVAAAHFGFSLEECEAYRAKMDAENAQFADKMGRDKKAYSAVVADLAKLSAPRDVENVYTHRTLDTLDETIASFNAALDERTSKYETELERQRFNDRLCKEFASLADPFVASLVRIKDEVTASQADLEAQLEHVLSFISKSGERQAAMGPISKKQAEMDGRGISHNRHTLLTATDCSVQVEQLGLFLDEKKKMLEVEIENMKLKGLTEQDLAEIKENFKNFAGADGKMNLRQLKSCMYAQGEEKKRSEVKALIDSRGTGGSMSGEQFLQLMIDILGVSLTKADILGAFDLICRGDVVNAEALKRMTNLLNEHDMAYVKKTAPKKGENYDYKAWTDDVFSR